MILKYNRLVIIFGLMCLSFTSLKINTKTTGVLPATALKPFGRYIVNKEQSVELISSAAHFVSVSKETNAGFLNQFLV